MSIPVPSVFVQHWFERAFNNGEAVDYSSLDAQNAQIVEVMNLITQRLNLISTSSGTLITLASTTSFTATASQTSFTVPAYDTATATIHAYTNSASGNLSRIPQASVTLASATTVTLPAQTVGATVIIDVYTPGNGTTALASTSSGQGASLVGVYDAAGYFTGTNVETVLAEIYAAIAALPSTANFINKNGSVTFTANQPMGGFKLTGLGAGTAASSDAARMADITSTALQATLGAYLAATYLSLSGGTMSGNIAMGTNKVTGLGAATANGQAVRYDEFQAIVATQITSGTLAAARMAVLIGDSGAGGVQGVVPAPAAGDAALSKFLSAGGTWSAVPSNLGGYCLIQDQKASGTSGGASLALAWHTRDINTEVFDTQNVCTVSANQFTLIAGTYRMKAHSVMYQGSNCVSRIRNVTSGSTVAIGLAAFDSSGSIAAQSQLFVEGRVTIAAPTVFELQYYCQVARATSGLGLPVTSGEVEVYSSIEIIKE